MSAEFLISLCWNFLWTKPAHAVCSLQALDKWGTVDILVNNAGTYSYQIFAPLHHQDARAVAETFLSWKTGIGALIGPATLTYFPVRLHKKTGILCLLCETPGSWTKCWCPSFQESQRTHCWWGWRNSNGRMLLISISLVFFSALKYDHCFLLLTHHQGDFAI